MTRVASALVLCAGLCSKHLPWCESLMQGLGQFLAHKRKMSALSHPHSNIHFTDEETEAWRLLTQFPRKGPVVVSLVLMKMNP